MSRLKCKKCNNVFEYSYRPFDSLVHLGPYKRIGCPACGRSSWFNVYSSVSDPVTFPPPNKNKEEAISNKPSEEELEKKRIEESKYENSKIG